MPRKKQTVPKRKPLNFNDPTLDASEMLPQSGGWALSPEVYPSLARFRFPGLDKPPKEPLSVEKVVQVAQEKTRLQRKKARR